MSSRSYVGRINNDGSIEAVYIHHDGYFSYVGNILLEEFNSLESVNFIISRGNASSITDEVGYEGSNEKAVLFENMVYYIDAFKNDIFIEYLYLFDTKKNQWLGTKNSRKLTKNSFKPLSLIKECKGY